jgi:DNA-binding NtrC family response regulator
MSGEKHAVARLLVVDDEALIRWSLGEHLMSAGYDVIEAADGASALDILGATARIDLIVLDLKLPDTDGLSLLRRIRGTWPTCKVVMMSAFATAQDVQDARQYGVAEIIPKPFDVQHLLKVVEQELANAA